MRHSFLLMITIFLRYESTNQGIVMSQETLQTSAVDNIGLGEVAIAFLGLGIRISVCSELYIINCFI